MKFAYGTKQIFFMKIDCEGGEYPFFEPATTDQIRHIKYVVGEFHKAAVEAPDYMFLKHGYERFKISENDDRWIICIQTNRLNA